MPLFYAKGSASAELSAGDVRSALRGVIDRYGHAKRVLAVPPDFSRRHSQAGPITCELHQLLGDRLTDVLPALGTHRPMTDAELRAMYPGLPRGLIRVHRWREDVVTLGEAPAEYVSEQTEGVWRQAWPAQTNRLIAHGGHDLIFSIGQVVPHEVIGMANYNKNIFVGAGGVRGINESHYLSAAYGMERIMGRADNPLRRIMNYTHDHFCRHLPIVYVLTVVEGGKLRGLFIGDDAECFERAAELSLRVNFTLVPERPRKVVVWLDPKEFKSTWLGNKAIYRTRMAIADGGELMVLAPGVESFGEDAQIDRLIRAHGYRPSSEVQRLVAERPDLRANLSAAAHLIHGSPEGRFKVTYCPGHLSREEVERVGYGYGELEAALGMFPPDRLADGWNEVSGDRFYYISNPALGLWAHSSRLPS
ncbi:MAG: lactate racemase domain-containing protein [Planctomycetota bacterium]